MNSASFYTCLLPSKLTSMNSTQPTQLSKQKPAPFHIQSVNPVNSSSLIPHKAIFSTPLLLLRPVSARLTLAAEPASNCFLRLHSDTSSAFCWLPPRYSEKVSWTSRLLLGSKTSYSTLTPLWYLERIGRETSQGGTAPNQCGDITITRE